MTTTVTINKHITINGNLPFEVEEYLSQRLTFANPAYLEKEERGYWTGDTPETLSFLERTEGGLIIPRGFISQLLSTLTRYGIDYHVTDETRALPEVTFRFQGSLYPLQREAVEAVLDHRFGVINAPTGSGKTVMGLYTIAQRKQPALVICHTKELMYQWRDKVVEFLGLPEDEIGLVGDGQKRIGAGLTIGIVNSIYKRADKIRDHIGFLLVDECHRTPARTFTEAVTAFDSRYMLGLSATPYRRDRLTKLIYYYLGDERYRIEPQALQELNQIMTPSLVPIQTGLDYFYRDNYQEMLTDLTIDERRNALIAYMVLKANGSGISLVLSDRKEHCRTLFNLLRERYPTEILTGEMSTKQRRETLERLHQNGVRILVATSQLIGEGFDLPPLERIFLATPIKFTGRVIQYIGRILRIAEGKTSATIYDFVDRPGVLQASFKSRQHAYRHLGVKDHG